MELEQIEQLYRAMVYGWFKNSFHKPQLSGLDSYVPMFKRMFREYALEMYEVDVIQLEGTRPEHWENWTASVIALVQ